MRRVSVRVTGKKDEVAANYSARVQPSSRSILCSPQLREDPRCRVVNDKLVAHDVILKAAIKIYMRWVFWVDDRNVPVTARNTEAKRLGISKEELVDLFFMRNEFYCQGNEACVVDISAKAKNQFSAVLERDSNHRVSGHSKELLR